MPYSIVDVRKRIIEIVTEKQGCKATEISVDEELAKAATVLGTDVVVNEIYQLANEGKLIEIEYVLPRLNFRIKSFMLPQGTKINIQGKQVF